MKNKRGDVRSRFRRRVFYDIVASAVITCVAEAFLVINIIAWTLITMGAGMLVCKFLGFSIGGNMTNLMCAGIYGGLIVGLIGGILYLYELYRHHSME